MVDDVQPDDVVDEAQSASETAGDVDPPAVLLAVAEDVTAGWLRRVGLEVAEHAGRRTPQLDADLASTADDVAAELIGLLGELLALDVDDQPVNPLSLFRAAVAGPTDVLRRHDVPAPPSRADFDRNAFPDDPYGIGPATWSDIDARLHEPGLAWGAWKAVTVLRRRRDEGLR